MRMLFGTRVVHRGEYNDRLLLASDAAEFVAPPKMSTGIRSSSRFVPDDRYPAETYRHVREGQRLPQSNVILALIAVSFIVSGCHQGEGERCQDDPDCEDGLVCCIQGQSAIVGGVCGPSEECRIPDAGSADTNDAAPGDSAGDANVDSRSDSPADVSNDASPSDGNQPADSDNRDVAPNDAPPTDSPADSTNSGSGTDS